MNGIVVGCLYLPNGNPQPGPKFDYKLAWFERLIKHARTLKKSGAPVVLAGDFNVVPTDADIYPSKSWDDDALLQPESRKAYARLLKQGWTDALRTLHPDEPMYTFWDYKRHRWQRDAGLRIETRYFLKTMATPQAKAMIRSLFLSMQELGKGASRPQGFPAYDVKKVAVIKSTCS